MRHGLPHAAHLGLRHVSLPLLPKLTDTDAERVIEAVCGIVLYEPANAKRPLVLFRRPEP